MMDLDQRDTGIAIPNAKRLKTRWEDFTSELAQQPAAADDEQLHTSNFNVSGPDGQQSDEDLANIHWWRSRDVARHLMTAAIASGELPVWLRMQDGEVLADRAALGTLDFNSFRDDSYRSGDPALRGALEYRPLWIRDKDWQTFVKPILAARGNASSNPSLSPAAFNSWADALSDTERNLPQPKLLELCQKAHPEHHVTRDRIRDRFGGKKRGPRNSAAK